MKPKLVVRLKKYNLASFHSLFSALPTNFLQNIDIIIWKGNVDIKFLDLKPDHPTMYLYSFMMPHFYENIREVKQIKENLPHKHKHIFVVGGAQATTSPETLVNSGFDVIVSGEGEAIIHDLLSKWLSNQLEFGIYRNNKAWVNLDSFDGFFEKFNELPPIEISRGCMYACNFCAVPRLYKCTVRHRSISKIIEIARKYKYLQPQRNKIRFLSSNAFAYNYDDKTKQPNLQSIINLLEGVRNVGFNDINFGSFPSEVRPDFIKREILQAIRGYLANKTIIVGFQAVTNELLDSMNRKHTVEQALEAINIIKDTGFIPKVDFIIGTPFESEEYQFFMLSFLQNLVKQYEIKIHMHSFMPLPGSCWEKFKPTPIHPKVKEGLRNLAKLGYLDGWWENQIGFTRKYMKLNKL